MRNNIVLVDYENVKAIDLRCLNQEDVRVIIFLGSHQTKLPSELAIQMQALGSRGEYVQMSGNGPNALDFHIAFTIGERSALGAQVYFHVISGDLGFDPLITYLKKRKILAARYKSIGDIPFVKASQAKTAQERAAYLTEFFQNSKVPRPQTVKTLNNVIRQLFHLQLADEKAKEILEVLRKQKYIDIQENKVVYMTPGK
ncbi:MAG: hypothetical protein JNM34_04405 [Chthonomonadaceae bacterium]|nr:hypothetical protein [Chthonomonadaceae bacterium]